MYGYVEGIAVSQDTILTKSGIGFRVTSNHLLEVGAEERLWLHTQINEKFSALYGFKTQTELLMFENLLKAQGVGPKLALSILNQVEIPKIVKMVEDQDSKTLASVTKGLGAATARRIIELKLDSSLKDLAKDETGALVQDPLVGALVSLGVDSTVAEATLTKTRKNYPDAEDGDILRICLVEISGGR